MDNSNLLRALSSPTIQVFGVALIVLILALNSAAVSLARPVAFIAVVVMLVIAAHWISQAMTRTHPRRQSHEHQ